MRVAILAYNGCFPSAVAGFRDVLAVASLKAGHGHDGTGGACFETMVVSDGGNPVQGFTGMDVAVDEDLGRALSADLLLVPPAFSPLDQVLDNPALVRTLIRAHGSGACICGACAGAFLLAETGLLDGRAATTHWALADAFRQRYPRVDLRTERMLVDGGEYVCAGGVTAFLDLALHLVARFGSLELAADCASTLLIDPGRTGQLPYCSMGLDTSHGDTAIARVQRHLHDHPGENLDVPAMAQLAVLGRRTFERRFHKALGMAPIRYQQAMRIERAKQLLATTREPVDTIMALAGYSDPSSFRRLFRKKTGLSPGEYRGRFSVVRG